ncbi:hypothetical protein SAMN05421847_2283 [Halpernia humi]|uniref:Uncharacterized protein n=1 Tax=Halpernia humi TaxID=493375 RepID=A0A1H5ZZ78_9FLAO|nr:hypothetical protein SAMN05421847_2283 [Halpernia humi]
MNCGLADYFFWNSFKVKKVNIFLKLLTALNVSIFAEI